MKIFDATGTSGCLVRDIGRVDDSNRAGTLSNCADLDHHLKDGDARVNGQQLQALGPWTRPERWSATARADATMA
ncbi:hypothetical protein C9397_20915 [Xanthomonas vasicola pv. vasculorum]|uniref:Uncharacterized protein n=1 Tax=Xanthomonas vasicola pv. vasculorum TaxID=325776 RepID=A0AAE8F757_XANVA|nr:hypothetical protein C7V42_04125 [Xanthomonas vasicola pv. vasculorum]AZR27941.1 hypothetical protein NX80_017405 [Xanthomonas vasicola pv. arecae]AZR29838.1 hypothetical protein KWO_004060 [Xanthomonas vasicola pv. musacearum NCPPB 4379]AZR33762.1 hypothetical protein NX08_003955 [Xanthomonas vasicola]RRJ43624.1 hypothetical protein EIM46_03990 [Xanthomonas vasicola pv. musacearum]